MRKTTVTLYTYDIQILVYLSFFPVLSFWFAVNKVNFNKNSWFCTEKDAIYAIYIILLSLQYLSLVYIRKQNPSLTRPALPCRCRALALLTKVSSRELI